MQASPEESAGLSGLRILVVEDTTIVAREIVRALETWGVVVVGPAATVAQALAAAATATLDGALLDINLEGEEVYPAALVLRNRGVPFIFLTGYASSALDPSFNREPMLEKPFGMKELSSHMRRVFASNGAAAPKPPR